jgi:beta-galactosidase
MTRGDTTIAMIRRFVVDRSKSRNMFSLNGAWELQPTNDDSIPSLFGHTIPVPSLVDLSLPLYDWQKTVYHWHRIEFAINELDSSQVVFLRIGQSQYGTQVNLNGNVAGQSISCYTSQEYRVDPWIRKGQRNNLLVRVGNKSTLPPESAVGNDQEKQLFIPGIWGDVSLVVTSRIRVKRTRINPDLSHRSADTTITLENLNDSMRTARVRARVFEKDSGRPSSEEFVKQVECLLGESILDISIPIDDLRLWSCQNPFLYLLRIVVESNGNSCDEFDTVFGMREFKIAGEHFFLNGNRILLRGSNIAFHRFLSDPQRKGLPWDREWIKKVLVDIPKAHNFNSFRFHLGQAYSTWYDIADEHGILIQNEWQFWRASGTKDQIITEFTEWMQDNHNHPSIIIWDALNECTEPMVEGEVVPITKKVDPTRPWEPNDFRDHHPYIYSLGPVLNDRKFGFAESIWNMERQTTPLVVNEFLWWWLDNEGKPTSLMEDVIERWMGRACSREAMLQHQAWLAGEMVELFRRLDADTIQPFVYLSNGNGPTGNWFLKDISYLQIKPILGALRNAFAPLGVSIELWDRHFVVAEKRALRVYVFNDHPYDCDAMLNVGIVDSRNKWVWQKNENVRLQASSTSVRTIEIALPQTDGEFRIRAEIRGNDSASQTAFSEKPAIVIEKNSATTRQKRRQVLLMDTDGEVGEYLRSCDIKTAEWNAASPEPDRVFLVVGQSLRTKEYESRRDLLSQSVSLGATLLIIEPEFDIDLELTVQVFSDVALKISHRTDSDRGGYDSFVFPEDEKHPVWEGLPPGALKMFNGALGGEIVSQHDVVPSIQHKVLARCGLGLNVLAAAEMSYGNGKIILWRLQVRGRLIQREPSENLYARRVDPVAQKLLLNLLTV